MKEPLKTAREQMDRKEFLNQVFRYGILGAIVLLTGFLFLNRKVERSSEACAANFACKNCGKYSACNLPEKQQ
ncbi:hypothetical protein [Roseimarinus sediminis]|uniref:hypothetical protein n=1 Tax=Roseimarinus sediminis TaxID=1610899 RepID=UPI003D1AA8CB